MDNTHPALPRIPVSTYRLQFNGQFRFSDATEIVPYLYHLGITDIYASPYFKAKEGSPHGYDIVDHSQLNPEVGTEEEYDAMTDTLRQFGMGQILDVVPNHMCITGKDNRWWMDVLENGRSSLHNDFFDIEWDPVKDELKDKVLLPILGDQYGRVLENQEISLSFEEGAFYVLYYDNKIPIRPQTYTLVLECGLTRLEEKLRNDDPHFMDFLSIITALKHLPSVTEDETERIVERIREKEVIKRRLASLCKDCPEIEAFILENIYLFNGAKGDPRSFDNLDKLLREQIYRLSYWQVATDEINYRRFFDINSLAAIRAEKPEVFLRTHDSIFRLIREGKVTGLRIDHPDGLYNPSDYFEKLQRECFVHTMAGHAEKVTEEHGLPYGKTYIDSEITQRYEEMVSENPTAKPFYIVGEKILLKSERMPEEWRTYSTTGYVFLNSLNGIFVETQNAKLFDRIYSTFIRDKEQYNDLVCRSKRQVMEVALTSEVNTLGYRLNRISEQDRYTRDFTLNSLVKALVEVITFFPVYRTYINSFSINDRDRQLVEAAVAKAQRSNPAISSSIFNFVRDVLLLRCPDYFEDDKRKEWLDFVMRFQQLTGPVMAKGVEDTTFYMYNRLVSLNEVGGSPDRFGTNLDTFHGQNIERSKFWPHAMITTTTHDTKRSEDVRARINVLSEIPFEWKDHLVKWRAFNKKKKIVVDGQPVPDRNEEYLLYQTLIGTWPLEFRESDNCATYIGRIKNYMIKAVREAKVNSSWISPNLVYEDAMNLFLDEIMKEKPENNFINDFKTFQRFISACGMYNSLSQTLLKIVSPGVPDFYQGSEIWDFSLVDPDNRRPVDYGKRMAAIEDIKRQESEIPCWQLARKLTDEKHDGRVKLFLIYRALNNRKRACDIYEKGEYRSLHVLGRKEYHVCALARRLGERAMLAAVPRFFVRLLKDPDGLPLGEDVWHDTVVAVPADGIGMGYRNIFTEEVLETAEHDGIVGFRCGDLFRNFPVALFEKIV